MAYVLTKARKKRLPQFSQNIIIHLLSKKTTEVRQFTTYTKLLRMDRESIPEINVSCNFNLWTSPVLNNDLKTFAFKSNSNP